VLVTGATGHVGGAVARQLYEQGHSVRALLRDPSGAASLPVDIELAVGDLDDPGSVSKAVTGAEAIFLMHVGTGTELALDLGAKVGANMHRHGAGLGHVQPPFLQADATPCDTAPRPASGWR
jgi:uncharacterized protein YbjT (DUF2867 family)